MKSVLINYKVFDFEFSAFVSACKVFQAQKLPMIAHNLSEIKFTFSVKARYLWANKQQLQVEYNGDECIACQFFRAYYY